MTNDCQRGKVNLKNYFYLIRRSFFWLRHKRKLNKIVNIKDFIDYIDTVNHKFLVFKKYKNCSISKQEEFRLVVKMLPVNLNGISFLDIGPGFGDSLDIAHEQRAKNIDFVEIDPFFFKYNQLKGFANGYHIDHLKKLQSLEKSRYDFIWSKGSISADYFVNHKVSVLANWLGNIERLASGSGLILICPEWLRDKNNCRIIDIHNNLFTNFLIDNGFEIIQRIEGHNSDPQYPITFKKIKSIDT